MKKSDITPNTAVYHVQTASTSTSYMAVVLDMQQWVPKMGGQRARPKRFELATVRNSGGVLIVRAPVDSMTEDEIRSPKVIFDAAEKALALHTEQGRAPKPGELPTWCEMTTVHTRNIQSSWDEYLRRRSAAREFVEYQRARAAQRDGDENAARSRIAAVLDADTPASVPTDWTTLESLLEAYHRSRLRDAGRP